MAAVLDERSGLQLAATDEPLSVDEHPRAIDVNLSADDPPSPIAEKWQGGKTAEARNPNDAADGAPSHPFRVSRIAIAIAES
jgi:hypothetical protein